MARGKRKGAPSSPTPGPRPSLKRPKTSQDNNNGAMYNKYLEDFLFVPADILEQRQLSTLNAMTGAGELLGRGDCAFSECRRQIIRRSNRKSQCGPVQTSTCEEDCRLQPLYCSKECRDKDGHVCIGLKNEVIASRCGGNKCEVLALALTNGRGNKGVKAGGVIAPIRVLVEVPRVIVARTRNLFATPEWETANTLTCIECGAPPATTTDVLRREVMSWKGRQETQVVLWPASDTCKYCGFPLCSNCKGSKGYYPQGHQRECSFLRKLVKIWKKAGKPHPLHKEGIFPDFQGYLLGLLRLSFLGKKDADLELFKKWKLVVEKTKNDDDCLFGEVVQLLDFFLSKMRGYLDGVIPQREQKAWGKALLTHLIHDEALTTNVDGNVKRKYLVTEERFRLSCSPSCYLTKAPLPFHNNVLLLKALREITPGDFLTLPVSPRDGVNQTTPLLRGGGLIQKEPHKIGGGVNIMNRSILYYTQRKTIDILNEGELFCNDPACIFCVGRGVTLTLSPEVSQVWETTLPCPSCKNVRTFAPFIKDKKLIHFADTSSRCHCPSIPAHTLGFNYVALEVGKFIRKLDTVLGKKKPMSDFEAIYLMSDARINARLLPVVSGNGMRSPPAITIPLAGEAEIIRNTLLRGISLLFRLAASHNLHGVGLSAKEISNIRNTKDNFCKILRLPENMDARVFEVEYGLGEMYLSLGDLLHNLSSDPVNPVIVEEKRLTLLVVAEKMKYLNFGRPSIPKQEWAHVAKWIAETV